MRITWDPPKRDWTLQERGLDFDDAVDVFAGLTLDLPDDRYDYGEVRVVSYGYLASRLVVIVWTERDDARHVISMRKANDREQKNIGKRLGTAGSS